MAIDYLDPTITSPDPPVPPPRKRTHDHTDINQFAWLIASGMTGTEAARQAARREHVDEPLPAPSIAAQRASNLLRREDVQDLVAMLRQRIADDMAAKYAVSRESVLRDLIDVKNRCMQAEPVLDHEGKPTGEYTFDSAGAIHAIKLIGMDLGMFVKQVRHTRALNDLTDEQLVERARNAVLQLTAIDAAIVGGGAIGADQEPGGRRGDHPSVCDAPANVLPAE